MKDEFIKKPENYLKEITGVYGEGNLEMLVRDGNKLQLDFTTRIEGRTRDIDPTEAMRLRVHDPLWMLARQWQMGEFRGNNTGTAMSVRCTVKYDDCSSGPIEPVTEQINPRMDFLAKIESAVYLLDLMKTTNRNKAFVKQFVALLIQKYPIDWETVDTLVLPSAVTRDEEKGLNKHLKSYARAYRGKIFDGEAVYKVMKNSTSNPMNGMEKAVMDKFIKWFEGKYKPASSTNSHWEAEDLSYTVETTVAGMTYKGDRYQGGRLSWYTFDYVSSKESNKSETIKPGISRPLTDKPETVKPMGFRPLTDKSETIKPGISRPLPDKPGLGKPLEVVTHPIPKDLSEEVLSLPTPATFAAAPNKRLWQMEDRKVFMGNSVEEPSEANSVVMRYTTMYSNDWMLFPLRTEIGKYVTVEKIEVVDTFGQRFVIDGTCRAGNKEKLGEREEQWQVFTNSTVGNRKSTLVNGLFFAPQLAATVEGKPVEEVKILRDEIANMVWGVENVVPDGCGGTLDANLYATRLKTIVDEQNKAGEPVREPDTIAFGQNDGPEVEKGGTENTPKAKFSYQLQSSVPFNWIPFVPQRLKTEDAKQSPFFLDGREIVLRRGKMPCYIHDGEEYGLHAVRPQGSIMRPQLKFVKNGGGKALEEPMVIHEEAVQATGIRLTKNYQRARWIGGQTYQWLGIYKRQAKTEASSGLVFDTLKRK